MNILTWLRGFQNKIANNLSFFCPSIPQNDRDIKKTPQKIEVCPESLLARLKYWNIESGLLQKVFNHVSSAEKMKEQQQRVH